LHEIVQRRLGDPFFGIFLNPGHQLHLDEWVNSPITAGSRSSSLRHGVPGRRHPGDRHPYFTTNIEDGIALADGSLRDEFARGYPRRGSGSRRGGASWPSASGIELHPDVLPFSNIPAWLAAVPAGTGHGEP
jgi:hypothetical protein